MTATATSTRPATGAIATSELPADLSPVVAALEKAYRMIQKAYPELPNATIVVKRDQAAWGHTTVAKTWSHASHEGSADRFEIMISGENLRRGAEAVVGTLLHEAAHARNLGQGVLDTDSNGRHNKAFAETAREHGLTVEEDGWRGWTKTALSEAGAKRWARMITMVTKAMAKAAAAAPMSLDHLGKALPTPPVPVGVGGSHGPARTGGLTGPRRRGNRNLLLAVCGCGLKIRASQGVLDAAQPTCQVCKEPFTVR